MGRGEPANGNRTNALRASRAVRANHRSHRGALLKRGGKAVQPKRMFFILAPLFSIAVSAQSNFLPSLSGRSPVNCLSAVKLFRQIPSFRLSGTAFGNGAETRLVSLMLRAYSVPRSIRPPWALFRFAAMWQA